MGTSAREGLLLPGQRCDLCGAALLLTAFSNRLGNMFCVSHADLPNCHMCSAPFRGRGSYCSACSATCVRTQDELRSVLPGIRGLLHSMGVILNPPVHVRLVDQAWIAKQVHSSGRVHGVTVTMGQRAVEIYILQGLPAMEFAASVAHECMHAWLAQNGFPSDLEPQVEEGLCQIVAYRWLRDIGDPRAELVRENIDLSPDPIYGDGFRLVKESVRKHGMNPVLAAVKATGRLP